MENDRCGYFDNGFNKDHEDTVNCRRCLLERLEVVTARVQELERELDDAKRMYTEIRAGISSGFLERAEAAEERVAELERDKAEARQAATELLEAVDVARAHIRELERERDATDAFDEGALLIVLDDHKVGRGDISLNARVCALHSRLAELEREVARLKEALAPFAAKVHHDGVEAPYPEDEWGPLLTGAHKALNSRLT